MRYYIIAGEASGDMHGANLMKGILRHDPEAEFRFWGGDKMSAVGGKEGLARHYRTASFFGITEVVKNLTEILRQLNECKAEVRSYAPDVLILIDYPGFNFKMAKYAHGIGITTFYYISPKVWAWKESRVKLIRRYVDQLFIIFPFEIEYFQQKGIEAIYEGNPLVDVIEEQRREMPTREEWIKQHGISATRPIVALLAGSRESEIRYNLPFMVELSKRFPEHQFVVGGVSWLEREVYDRVLSDSDVIYLCDQTFPLIVHAEAAIVTSGTATLETALIGTPELVCYSRDKLSMNVARLLITIRFISLVNLILGREAVRELIQWDMTLPKAEEELGAILPGGEKREKMLADYRELSEAVGEAGASERFAGRMVELLKTKYKIDK